MNMVQTTLEPKTSAEIVPIIWTYDDTDRVIAEARISVTTYSGTDPHPANILVGSLIVSPHVMTQYIGGGLSGCMYKIICNYSMNDLSIYTNAVYIEVQDD